MARLPDRSPRKSRLNRVRPILWRAGHAHAGVLVILTLLALRYVDEATLSHGMKWFVRLSLPSAAIFLPVAFFFSVLTPDATAPNGFIYLAYIGAVILAAGVLTLGIGLLRGPKWSGAVRPLVTVGC
jgi:hypothetical protein